MKNWMKNNYKILSVVLGFVLIGPIVINYLFKLQAPLDIFVAEWDASSILSYYGTIIAAVIAIYGIYITLQYSQKNYKDDVRNRSMPFIVIEMLKTSSCRSLMKQNSTENVAELVEGYREYKLTDYYCVLNQGNIIYKTGLTKSQQEILDNGGTKWVSSNNGNSVQVVVNVICLPLEIENIGNGTAIRMRYGVNRKQTSEADRKYLPTLSLKTGVPMMLHIFSDDCSKDSLNLGGYVLSFYYEDIYSNRYEQHFDINIEYDEKKSCPICSVDMSHVQNFLGGK